MLLKKSELNFILKTLDKRTKLRFAFFFFLVILVAIGEYFTIGESGIFAKKLLGIKSAESLDKILGIDHSLIFLILVIITNTGRALISYYGLRLSFISSSQVCQKVYNNYLQQNYLKYLSINSSELISVITTKINTLATDLILPFIRISSSILIIIFIGISIFKKAPLYSIFSLFSVFISYLIVSLITSNSMKKNSIILSRNSSKNIKIVQETVISFREIKLSGFENKFFNQFANNEFALRLADANVRVLSEIPRYVIESMIFAMIIIVSLIFNSYTNSNNSILISSLGSFLYGSQRLLPLAQNTYRSYSTIRASTFSIKDIIKFINFRDTRNNRNKAKVSFNKKIILKSVGFSYPKTKNIVLENCNLEINKGDFICIVGKTGSGKSTLIDIIMGLITPTKGKLYVDNQDINKNNQSAWMRKISHVPQEIILMDDTIRRNIAFGFSDSEIDNEQLNNAIKLSSLDKVISNLKNGLDTIVGERGLLLSGGQKQRIGIARAIYQNKEIMVLDEATSALDKKTESMILFNLINYCEESTLIMVTHRPKVEIKYDKTITIKDLSIYNL
tara:strand:- start:396 stop:2087 length:1692 start_codon:yes stop_codon:yes gene_type:complete